MNTLYRERDSMTTVRLTTCDHCGRIMGPFNAYVIEGIRDLCEECYHHRGLWLRLKIRWWMFLSRYVL